jgi:hypothetical protein
MFVDGEQDENMAFERVSSCIFDHILRSSTIFDFLGGKSGVRLKIILRGPELGHPLLSTSLMVTATPLMRFNHSEFAECYSHHLDHHVFAPMT